MLLELEIENERTFATASLLSLVASKLKEADIGAVRDVGDLGRTKALTAALILGKNGSGKSSLINAYNYIGKIVRNSARESQQDEALPYEPNLLCEGCKDNPTKYRILFSFFGNVYNFQFAFNAERILEESLEIADKSPRFRKMYERVWNSESESYSYNFGDALTGTRRVWQDNTRDNALYLSTAVQLNSDDLREPFEWLTKYLRGASINTSGQRYTTDRCREDEGFRKKVVGFLQAMDINVQDIRFLEEDIPSDILTKTFAPEFLTTFKINVDDMSGKKNYKPVFEKKAADGSLVELPFSEESTGTRALYCLAGPLYDTLENGYCLLIDEINTSLHPLVVKFLVDMFADPKLNAKRAQLIFTSHDVSILRDGALRRDQVWFIDNDGCSASLVPLSDYSPRRGEAVERGYLRGRYGGVPTVDVALFKAMGVS